VLRGFETRAWQKKLCREREREEGKRQRGRLTDTSASPKTLSLLSSLSLSSSFLAIYFPDMLFRVLK
jgi:hypothetical protein